jgi:hypothetical protein
MASTYGVTRVPVLTTILEIISLVLFGLACVFVVMPLILVFEVQKTIRRLKCRVVFRDRQ